MIVHKKSHYILKIYIYLVINIPLIIMRFILSYSFSLAADYMNN